MSAAQRKTASPPQLDLYRDSPGARPPSRPFVSLVPGTAVPLMRLDLPDTLSGMAREQVARRQLTDNVGLPEKALELRPYSAHPLRDRWSRVLVAGADDAAGWRNRKQVLGTNCRAILPDYLALPAAAGLWTVQADDDIVLARLGLDDGFTCEPALAAILLERAFAEAAPDAVYRLGGACPSVDTVLERLKLKVLSDEAALKKSGLTPPRRFANGELGFDLSRDLAAAADVMHRGLRSWRLPVALAALALAIWSVGTLVRTADLRAGADRLRQSTTEAVRVSFVPTGPILDVRLQVSQALAAMQVQAAGTGPTADALAILRMAGTVTLDHGAVLQSAQSQPDGQLDLSLSVPDFAALDRLVAALEQAGLAVAIADASAADDATVRATLTLQTKARS